MTATAPPPPELAPRTGAPPTAAGSVTRMPWLDNVRVWLTVLVLAHHAALTYSDLPIWPYWEQPRDGSALALDALVATNQAWFMGLFFLISGFFVPGGVDRHGVAGFVRGRLLRLGVPFLLFLVLLSPIYRYPGWASGAKQQGQGFLSYLVTNFDPGPLWFVAVLLVFSLVYAAVRAVTGRRRVEIRTGRTPGVLVIVGLGLALGLLSYVWRIGTPEGSYWEVVGLPSPAYLPQYIGCFVLGVLAARRSWLQTLRARTGWACLPVLLVSFVAWLGAVAGLGEVAMGGGTPESLLVAVAGSVFAVTAMVIGLVVFRTLLDRNGPVARFLSGQAFAVYVIHAPVLVWLGVALAGFAAPAAVKALVLLAAGVVACWTLSWLLRRIPGATRVF